MEVSGFSHVTIAVRDLPIALRFYADLLGMRLVHRGEHDAYLEWGSAWICLLEQPDAGAVRLGGVDHVAFHIAEDAFPAAVALLQTAQVPIVRGPVRRGPGWSINFLDPDGTQLELHTSTLAARMATWT